MVIWCSLHYRVTEHLQAVQLVKHRDTCGITLIRNSKVKEGFHIPKIRPAMGVRDKIIWCFTVNSPSGPSFTNPFPIGNRSVERQSKYASKLEKLYFLLSSVVSETNGWFG
jgi:hypothetical protein